MNISNAHVRKIKTYRKKGYMQHTNLICTWEEDLLQVKQLEEILETVWRQILSGIPYLIRERRHDSQTVVSGNAGILRSHFDLVFSWKRLRLWECW